MELSNRSSKLGRTNSSQLWIPFGTTFELSKAPFWFNWSSMEPNHECVLKAPRIILTDRDWELRFTFWIFSSASPTHLSNPIWSRSFIRMSNSCFLPFLLNLFIKYLVHDVPGRNKEKSGVCSQGTCCQVRDAYTEISKGVSKLCYPNLRTYEIQMTF